MLVGRRDKKGKKENNWQVKMLKDPSSKDENLKKNIVTTNLGELKKDDERRRGEGN